VHSGKQSKKGMIDDPFLQCHLCYKWRPISKGSNGTINLKDASDKWCCSDNPMAGQNTCSAIEVRDLIHTNRKIKRREAKGGRKRKKSEEAELSTEDEEEEEAKTEGGREWVGRRAKAYWQLASGSAWYFANIDDFDADANEYKLTYDNGTFAWAPLETFSLVEKPKPSVKKEKVKPQKKRPRVVKYEEIEVDSLESEEDGEHDGAANNAVKDETQVKESRQKSVNDIYKNMKIVLEKIDTIRTGDSDLEIDKFDGLGIKEMIILIRDDLNCVLK